MSRFVVLALCFALHQSLAAAARNHDPSTSSAQRISLDVHNAGIGDVLRLIATASGLNIIASPHVKGTVTARLIDVPWDQALDVILKLHGLVQERHGNVVVIAPLRPVLLRRQAARRAEQMEASAEPTVTRVIPVNYAKAAALKAIFEKVLGSCAAISAYAPTNTLIITGTPSCLRRSQLPQGEH